MLQGTSWCTIKLVQLPLLVFLSLSHSLPHWAGMKARHTCLRMSLGYMLCTEMTLLLWAPRFFWNINSDSSPRNFRVLAGFLRTVLNTLWRKFLVASVLLLRYIALLYIPAIKINIMWLQSCCIIVLHGRQYQATRWLHIEGGVSLSDWWSVTVFGLKQNRGGESAALESETYRLLWFKCNLISQLWKRCPTLGIPNGKIFGRL